MSHINCSQNDGSEHSDLSENDIESSDSESCSCETSSDSSSCFDYVPSWINKVDTQGAVFFFEPAVFSKESGQSNKFVGNSDLAFCHSDKKMSTTEKLQHWMKQRKVKTKHLKDLNANQSFMSKSHFPSEIKPVPPSKFEVKEIDISVDPYKHNYGRRAPLCESLLGVTIGLLSYVPDSLTGDNKRNKIAICDFTAESEAHKNGEIQTGDWLIAVDGVEVTLDNINAVLSNIKSPKKVKLLLHSLSSSNSVEQVDVKSNFSSYCGMVKQVIHDSQTNEKAEVRSQQIPHGLFCFAVPKENCSESDDVLYRYPDQDTPLFQLKGMFVTLCHMILDVASSPPLCSSLIVQEEIVHVGYVTVGDVIMILALPSACVTAAEVQHFTNDFANLLKFQFSSLERAFGLKENKDYLDDFCALYFCHMLSPHAGIRPKLPESHLMQILPSIHWLPLPPHIKIHIDDALSHLESADFGYSTGAYYGIQRVYSILGSCYFYKGFLLGSHLQKSDLLDIHSYLQHHYLLTMSKKQSISEALIWKEMHLSKHYQENMMALEPGFEETNGRWFLLIAALNHSILAVILESGGCALSVDGNPSPDNFYINQTWRTLLHLENTCISSAVDNIIDHPDPPVVSPELFLKEEKQTWNPFSAFLSRSPNAQSLPQNSMVGRRFLSYSSLNLEGTSLHSIGEKKMHEQSVMLKKDDDAEGDRQQLLLNTGSSDCESDADNGFQNNSEETNMFQGRKHFRRCSTSNSSNAESQESFENPGLQVQTTKPSLYSSCDLSKLSRYQDSCNFESENETHNLVAGYKNTLFHYLLMDPVEGVFLAPTACIQEWMKTPAYKEMLQAFHKCCLNMRVVFEKSLRNKEFSLKNIITKFGINKTFQAVYEQGVLFQYSPPSKDQKKPPAYLNFWVIGRLFFAPEPREVYVCYHDSAEQSIVELAFRLGFGLSL